MSNRSTVLDLIGDGPSIFETETGAAKSFAEHRNFNMITKSEIPSLSKEISELPQEDRTRLELAARKAFNNMPNRDKLFTDWDLNRIPLVQTTDLNNHEDDPCLWFCRKIALQLTGDCAADKYSTDDTVKMIVSLVQNIIKLSFSARKSQEVVASQRQGGHDGSSKEESEKLEPVNHVVTGSADEFSDIPMDETSQPKVKPLHYPDLATSRSDDSKWKCPICSKGFVQHGDLKDHILLHGINLATRCNICKIYVGNILDMERHIENSHQQSSPKVPALPAKQASSYWCVFDATLFPYVLRSFGSNWEAIAAFMGTKTATMVSSNVL